MVNRALNVYTVERTFHNNDDSVLLLLTVHLKSTQTEIKILNEKENKGKGKEVN